MKKLEGISDCTLLGPPLNKSLPSEKKYLTRYLVCINIIQYEGIGSRESKVNEEDPKLFRNATGEPGGFISQMREEGVSM